MRLVLCDAVAVDGVARGHDLPRHPASNDGLVTGEHVREMAWLKPATALVVCGRFRDGFHLTLVAVGALGEREGGKKGGERERGREGERENGKEG